MTARIKAFIVHLACSITVAGVLAYVVFGVWYPVPLDKGIGVRHVFLVMLGVDASLGPLMTLIVFKEGKKHLAFDLGIIISVQIAALVYGVATVAQERPVWLVFNADRFDAVTASDIADRYRRTARPEYQPLSWTGPRWVAAVSPEDQGARNRLMTEALSGGADLPQRPNLYQPLESTRKAITQHEKALSILAEFNSEERVDAVRAKWPRATAWLPLMARMEAMVVLVDADHNVVAIADLRPWTG